MLIRLPGLIDTHVHLREPGAEYKEDWDTGTRAALAGGFTMIGVMPNTDPPICDRDSMDLVKGLAKTKAHCDYGLYLGANASNYLWKDNPELTDDAIALKMYLNNTYGPLLLPDTTIWARHLENWPKDKVVCVHSEGHTLAAMLCVAQQQACRSTIPPIHVCHVSREEELVLIRNAKDAGMRISCEVAPHHLFSDRLMKLCPELQTVKPPLSSHVDQDALWRNMDIIDCFATDHAPHTVDDKKEHGCPGFPGLETALPLLLTAVSEGKISMEDIIQRCYTNPKRIFGLPDQDNTYIEVDPEHVWTIPDRLPHTKCGWSPFAGMQVQGIVCRVVLRGETVFRNGQMLSTGHGRLVRTTRAKVPIPRTLLSVHDMEWAFLEKLFKLARELEAMDDVSTLLSGRLIATLFYEPSTRTRCSFTAAAKRMGADVIDVNAASSSVTKGESLMDTIRTLESYTDLTVVRYKKCLSYSELAGLENPFINAGDGTGEHPTQALLDVYTMIKELGSLDGKTIALVGDLKHGRTVHSLAKLLTHWSSVRLFYISDLGLGMLTPVCDDDVDQACVEIYHWPISSFAEILPEIDVLYLTRLQRERGASSDSYVQLTPELLTRAKEDMIIMHPLPRVDEIDKAVDVDPRAAYFRQMRNGMYVRMALLKLMLDA